jgi:secondary thiamine-phosphate synthase enzyme
MLSTFSLKTGKADVVQITQQVQEAVAKSGVERGLCTVFIPHTTAALTITSFWDPRGLEDIQDEVNRLIPTRIDFRHQHDTPQDAAGHVKSAVMGITLALIVDESKVLLGHSQGIYFLEFDGPRNREFFVKIIAG